MNDVCSCVEIHLLFQNKTSRILRQIVPHFTICYLTFLNTVSKKCTSEEKLIVGCCSLSDCADRSQHDSNAKDEQGGKKCTILALFHAKLICKVQLKLMRGADCLNQPNQVDGDTVFPNNLQLNSRKHFLVKLNGGIWIGLSP